MTERASESTGSGTDSDDLEKYLEQREKMESLFEEKYHKVLTVMFTDLKGSTAIAENEGDLVSRTLIKHQNEIIFPAIEENRGVFVKSIGDGTLSHFALAQDAVRAAVHIQRGMHELNMSKKFKTTVLMRIGMHTGKCVMDKDDISGDTVNTASRFESSAHGGEIYLSETTFDALTDQSELYCRFAEQVILKGKREPYNAYKAFWDANEIELDKRAIAASAVPPPPPPITLRGKLMLAAGAVLLLMLLALLRMAFFGQSRPQEEQRSIQHSAAAPAPATRG